MPAVIAPGFTMATAVAFFFFLCFFFAGASRSVPWCARPWAAAVVDADASPAEAASERGHDGGDGEVAKLGHGVLPSDGWAPVGGRERLRVYGRRHRSDCPHPEPREGLPGK